MLPRRSVAAVTVAFSLVLAPLASAQTTQDSAPVTSGATKKGRRPKKPLVANPTGPLTSFVGFRSLDDGSTRIYVDVASTVPVDEKRESGVLHYLMKGARVGSRNATNWLVTTFRNTPVKRARLVPSADGVELLIELRAETAPTQRLVPGPHGGATLQIDFPAGNFPDLEETPPETKKKKGKPGEEQPPPDDFAPPTEVLPIGPNP
jgi:hypothetical protein